MTRTVFCRKYQQELEGLDFPPMPGKKGQEIWENVSKKAWEEWQNQQTMLINEKHLSLMDPNTQIHAGADGTLLQQRAIRQGRRLRATGAIGAIDQSLSNR